MICVAVKKQEVKQSAHKLVKDIRFRGNVRPDELHGRLFLCLVEKHVCGYMVDCASAQRAYGKICDIIKL